MLFCLQHNKLIFFSIKKKSSDFFQALPVNDASVKQTQEKAQRKRIKRKNERKN